MQGGCIKSQAIKHHLLLKTGDVCPLLCLHRFVTRNIANRRLAAYIRTMETIPNMRFARDMGHGTVRIDVHVVPSHR